jgi:hypothetical protein
MAKFYKYRKATDYCTTHILLVPDGETGIAELCTIDGETYVSVPDAVTLPPQPDEIKVFAIELTAELDAAIRAASPHIALANERIVERIREKYSVNDELKMLRIGPSPETEAYNDHVEKCRAWGKAEKEKLFGAPLKSDTASWMSSKDELSKRIAITPVKVG